MTSFDTWYTTPPEPRLSHDDKEDLAGAYNAASAAFEELDAMDKEPGGYDFSQEKKAAMKALEDLMSSIEEAASDNGVRV